MSQVDLVIFDLDGTLVASEHLAEQVQSRVIEEELGLDIPETEIAREFRGRSLAFTLVEIEKRYGRPLPETFLPILHKTYSLAVKDRLEASPGVEMAIKALLPISLCIASNGEPETIALSVQSVGLSHYFEDNYFSAFQVQNPKPAPDVFLLAAEKMGAEPARCVVVEDTVVGMTGALEAGMSVIGYAGNHPETADVLRSLNQPVITDYSDLAALIIDE